MTNKILITVVVPVIEERYDIYIPISKSIKVTKKLLVKTINELSGEHFPEKNNCILMSNEGRVFPSDSTIKECGLKNGDKIILI